MLPALILRAVFVGLKHLEETTLCLGIILKLIPVPILGLQCQIFQTFSSCWDRTQCARPQQPGVDDRVPGGVHHADHPEDGRAPHEDC